MSLNNYTYHIQHKGQAAICYGAMRPRLTFEVICHNEENDTVLTPDDADYPKEGFSNWTQLVRFLIDVKGLQDIDEVHAKFN